MNTNRTKAKLLNGELAVGIFVMGNHPHVPGVIAAAGFDFAHFDMEHTSLSLEGLEGLVRATDAAGITPLTRIPGSAKRDILATLEAGVQGIMVPAVESAEEAAQVVQFARYFPEGRRGMFYMGYPAGYTRISSAEHYASSNRELLVTIQIETAAGVENAADIAAVPGVDVLFIGPADLSQSLGIPGQWQDERLRAAIDHTIRAARDAGKVAGAMSGTLDQAEDWVEKGVRMLTTGVDMVYLHQALRAETAALRERLGWRGPEG